MATLYAVDEEVLVLFPLPDDDVNDRTTWHWLDGLVIEVTEFPTTEYAIQVQDDRVSEPDPTEDSMTYPVCFRDASEVQPRRSTASEAVRVVIEGANADQDGLAVVEVMASAGEFGDAILLNITADGMSVMAGLNLAGSTQLRTALEQAEQHVEGAGR